MRAPLPRLVCQVLLAAALLAPAPANAHWCNNIWAAPSRIVVKPEVTTLNVGASGASLRVYVQNNLPYRLFSAQMQGTASGYTVAVTPSQQDIQPGQNVAFTFKVSGGAGGTVKVDTLGLQLKFRPSGYPNGWLDKQNNCLLNHDVSASTLAQGVTGWWQTYSACGVKNQSTSLNAATLADKDPKATLPASAPTLGRTGIQELIKLFGYRFCYNGSGTWRCGGQDCPGACAEGSAWANTNQFPQNCLRAGVELAARKTKLGSNLAAARAGAVNALKGGCSLWTKPTQHKCLAAVVGAYLWAGASNTATLSSAVKDAGSCVPKPCQDAALRILGGGTKGSCAGLSAYEEQAACAAAEGLRGEDSAVKDILMAKAGDGYQPSGGNYRSLYYAYMLYIVTAARKATGSGTVSYFPDAGAPLLVVDLGKPQLDAPPLGTDIKSPGADGPATSADKGTEPVSRDSGCALVSDVPRGAGSAALLVSLMLLLFRRRQLPK